jgi:NADPH-dependent 2,4-dienoyl-CoA reductase/sulfur reductase-like enzyme
MSDYRSDYRYVIVGGGLAGGKAVEGIRAVDEEGSIALVTNEPRRPYHRPPLSKAYLRGEEARDEIFVADEAYYDAHDVDVIANTDAVRLDRETQTIGLSNGEGLSYEKLLLTTGGRAKTLPIPGNALTNVFTLRWVEDADAIREAAGEGKHALILGGSFIGSEVAASLTMMGTDVTMVFPESRLLERIVPPAMSEYLHAMYEEKGVTILPGVTPEALLGNEHVTRARLSNGTMLDVDLVVMGVGIELNTMLARESNLRLNEEGAVIVDAFLGTSDPHIYAAGDIAAWPDPTFDKRMRVEHWDVARSQGLRAGRNMAGEEEAYTTLPYFFSDLFDLSFEVWGDLSDWERFVLRGELEARSFTFFYFAGDGKLSGVFTMGRPEEEREPMQQLIRARPAYDDVADSLQDASQDLAALV